MSPKRIIALCLLISTTTAWGGKSSELSLGTETTENGYSTFCNGDAKIIIEKLNTQSEEKLKSVKEYTTKIDSLNAQKNLLDGLNKMKDQYLSSLKSISDDEKGSIDNFKNLLKSSVTLSAVSMLLNKMPNKDKIDYSSVDELCKDPNNASSKLCQSLKPGSFDKFLGVFGYNRESDSKKSLDQTLKNFSATYDLVDNSDKPDLNVKLAEFQKSLDQFPIDDTITILADSENFIPSLASNDRSTIEKCLKNDVTACTNLMSVKNRDKVSETLNSEMKDASKKFQSKRYQDFFEQYDKKENPETRFKNLIDSISSQVRGQGNTSATSLLDQTLVDKFKTYCSKSSETYNLAECLKNNQAIAENIKAAQAKNDEQLKKLNDDLTTALNKGGSLEGLEKMKKYVGDKYLRSCPNADPSDKPLIRSNICQAAINTIGLDSTDQLSAKMLDIVVKLSKDNTLSTNRGEKGAFSKDELKVYSNYCQNTSLGTSTDTTKLICNDIYQEQNRLAKIKEAKDWDEFYDKYWVEYNPRSKNGYDVYEKKSNLRIVGEGVSQSIGKIYPIWMNNQQLKYQVDYMTNQALYQKQLNYMYSYGSPWMNYSYFQGAYFNSNFNTSNPFLWSTGTTGTATSTTVPKTGGFSF